MNSSMVNKIVKAKQYAQEPHRVNFEHLEVSFEGDNGSHRVRFDNNVWDCSCDFFAAWKICCHTMAMERLLEPMISVKQNIPEPAVAVAV